ncbi:MAG: helix-turn-helix domain-containing protein, partial [Myxococcota bacterium]
MIQVVHRDPEVAALFVAALRRLGHLAPPPVYDAGAAVVAFRNRQCPCGLIAETLIEPGDGIQLAGIVRSMWSAEIVMIADANPLVGEGATVSSPDVKAVSDALPSTLTMPNISGDAAPSVGLPPSSLRRIINYVETNISGCLSLEALSAEVGMSPDRFGRLFREALGDTPHQFIIRRRMMKAIHLLQRTTLSVTQIAVECGYRGASNFVQAFKRFAGETPGAMRNRLRGRPLAVEAFAIGVRAPQPASDARPAASVPQDVEAAPSPAVDVASTPPAIEAAPAEPASAAVIVATVPTGPVIAPTAPAMAPSVPASNVASAVPGPVVAPSVPAAPSASSVSAAPPSSAPAQASMTPGSLAQSVLN